MRDGGEQGGSIREQDSIFISIPVFIASLQGVGREGAWLRL